MVDHEQQRARYLAGADGAPPIPPAGGYRGARRSATAQPAAAPLRAPSVAVAAPEERQKPNVLGWVALIAGAVFALILLIASFAGGTNAIYSVTVIMLQLLVAGVIIAALATRRGRTLGAIALSIALVANVGTIGALGAVQTSASGSYDGTKTEEQKHEEGYPGVKGTSNTEILTQPSLEEVRTQSEAALEDIKAQLSAKFGYTWVLAGEENLRPERNGYGGESMLSGYTSVIWATNEPIQDYSRKIAVMDVIDQVLYEHGLWGIIALNDPNVAGISKESVEKLYGDADPHYQDVWDYYSNNYPDPIRFHAVINDTSKDETGGFLKEREAQSQRSGAPLEGLQVYFMASEMLSEADREAFEAKIKEYDGF